MQFKLGTFKIKKIKKPDIPLKIFVMLPETSTFFEGPIDCITALNGSKHKRGKICSLLTKLIVDNLIEFGLVVSTNRSKQKTKFTLMNTKLIRFCRKHSHIECQMKRGALRKPSRLRFYGVRPASTRDERERERNKDNHWTATDELQ